MSAEFVEKIESGIGVPVSGSEYFSFDRAVRREVHVTIIVGLVLGLALTVFKTGVLDGWIMYMVFSSGAILITLFEMILLRSAHKRIKFDFARRVVVLENFVYATSFLDVLPKREIVISFDDVLAIHQAGTRRQGALLSGGFVYTRQARFSVMETFSNYARLKKLFLLISDESPCVPIRRNFGVVSFLAGLIGLGMVALIGWMLGWI